LHRVVEAIAPNVGLQNIIVHWNEITAALGERNRQRKPQISTIPLKVLS
jgi:hypothetical protein